MNMLAVMTLTWPAVNDILALTLTWAALGIICGGLARLAGLGVNARSITPWRALALTAAAGGATALAGGLASLFVFGRFFSLPAALGLALLATVAVPWLIAGLRARRGEDTKRNLTPE